MIKKYDIIVIGAGSGGLTFTSVAAQLGFKVALVEGNKMGGDCLNYGCVPSKSFLYASKKFKNFKKTFEYIQKSIETIEPHDSEERFTNLGVDVYRDYGRFIAEDAIKVGQLELHAPRIIIATGSRAFIPSIEGLNKINFLTNENVFSLKTKPKSIVILGGGPIGIEVATAFNNLGVKTVIIQHGTGILKNDDQELTEILKEKLIKDGIEIFENCNLKSVKNTEDLIDFEIECDGNNFILSASHFLIATGRVPNTEKLDLDNAFIKYSTRGYIITDNKMRTNNKNVYAIGDVAGHGLFTHLASYQASIVIKRILFGSLFTKTDYTALPWTTFSSPELANIGLTEEKAKDKYKKIKVFSADFKEIDRAITDDAKLGKVKIILNSKGRTIGVSMLGKNAGELIQQWTPIVQQKAKPSKLLKQIYTYPTLSDINRLVASKEYQELFFSKIVKLISKFLFNFIGSKY